MLTFTLAISYLTTSNLPWFMDLTFQVPMKYCSLLHQTLLLSPVASTTGYCFCFGSISLFFLELFLHWSPVAYWAPTNPGSSPFSILSFCFFILFMGFSRQEYWSGLPPEKPINISVMYICQSQSPNSSHHTLSHFDVHKFVLYVSVSISTLQIVEFFYRYSISILLIPFF